MKSTFSNLMASVFGAIFLFMPLQVAAEDSYYMEMRFEGEIQWEGLNVENIKTCLGEEFPSVNRLTGSFTYDANVEPVFPDPLDRDTARYYQDTAFYGLRIEGGGIWFETVPDEVPPGDLSQYSIEISEGWPWEVFFVNSNVSESSIEGVEGGSLQFGLFDGDLDAIDSVDLPKDALNLDDWVFSMPNSVSVNFKCDDVSLTVVWAILDTLERVYPVDDIVDATQQLLDADALEAEQERGLYQKVASAMAKFDRGKTSQACSQLHAFMCQLEALLPMFEPPNDELAEAILEAADVIFVEECDEEEYASCAIGFE